MTPWGKQFPAFRDMLQPLRYPAHKAQTGFSKTCLLEQLISLNDVAKSFFGPAVATIRIGMMLLHEFFIARLDLIASRIWFKTKRSERFTSSVRGLRSAVLPAGAAFASFTKPKGSRIRFW